MFVTKQLLGVLNKVVDAVDEVELPDGIQVQVVSQDDGVVAVFYGNGFVELYPERGEEEE